MEKLLLVGCGGLGRVVLEHVCKQYKCSFIDDSFRDNKFVCSTRVIGKISDLPSLKSEYRNLIITIGDNNIREKIYYLAKSMGYNIPNIIAQSAYVSPFSHIGNGCIFLNNTVIQNGTYVGNGVILNPGVELHHDSKVGDFSLIYTNSVIRTQACVGDRVKIGSNVTIANFSKVNSDNIIIDGSVI